jgi:DNA-binding NtrC family response regulator
MTRPLLLVEDTQSLSMVYQTVLRRAGYAVDCAFTLNEAVGLYDQRQHQIVLLDLTLPDGDGLDLMARILAREPESKILVITANGSITRAVEAMRAGAFDFLVKPFDEHRLLGAIRNALDTMGQDSGKPALPAGDDGYAGFIGNSPPMRDIYRMVNNIGRSTATVFITGESGTGKEVCAQAIHGVSTRARGPFVPLNCGAIPQDLIESEVFGHLKGSFTGAISDKKGAAAAADGGTLFLDEICEMPLALQTKLLRFLQTSQIQPVGAITPRHVDVRIVCATNRDPAAEVRAGRFREDLYYRLHVVPIHLPPLRERHEDTIAIARRKLVEFAREEGKSFEALDPEVEAIFAAQPWPGNVRQLLNVIRNVVVLHDGKVVTPDMLPAEILQTAATPAGGADGNLIPFEQFSRRRDEDRKPAVDALATLVGTPLANLERDFIEATIRACNGSVPQAARLLDVSPSTIYRKKEGWDRKLM